MDHKKILCVLHKEKHYLSFQHTWRSILVSYDSCGKMKEGKTKLMSHLQHYTTEHTPSSILLAFISTT